MALKNLLAMGGHCNFLIDKRYNFMQKDYQLEMYPTLEICPTLEMYPRLTIYQQDILKPNTILK